MVKKLQQYTVLGISRLEVVLVGPPTVELKIEWGRERPQKRYRKVNDVMY